MAMIVWLIYGNTFIYSQAAKDCSIINEESKEVYNLMRKIIIYGYGLFILFLAGILLLCIFFVAYGRDHDRESNNSIVEHIPYLNAVQSLKKQKYSDKSEKILEQCVICMVDF